MFRSFIYVACLLLIFGFSDLSQDEYVPVIMSRQEMESAIELQSPRDLKNPGKIYFKDEYIFIGEKYKGIHVINNQDSLHPQNIAFIRIPGCIDMAIRRDILYADNAVDLISIRLKDDLSGIEVTSRNKDVFPEMPPPGFGNIPWKYHEKNRPENTIIVEWKKRDEV